MKRLLLTLLLLAALSASAVQLLWDYPDSERSPDLVFEIYRSADLQSWQLLVTLPATATNYVLTPIADKTFFRMRASNVWTDVSSDFSNVITTAPARAVLQRITK